MRSREFGVKIPTVSPVVKFVAIVSVELQIEWVTVICKVVFGFLLFLNFVVVVSKWDL